MKKIVPLILGLAIVLLPFGVKAGMDETQRLMSQRIMEAKQKLAAAEAAKGAERQRLMQDHMKLMQDVLAQMHKAKPAAGMTPEQMHEWIEEHLKLMDQLMGQMMSEHHLLMQTGAK